jgi:hypothetical protein
MRKVIQKRKGTGIDIIHVTIKWVGSPFYESCCKTCPELFGYKKEKVKVRIACKAERCTRKLKIEPTGIPIP